MASIFALEKNEQRNFAKVPRPARAKFCEIENAHYVKCYTIEQYSVMENIELCTMFCSDELEAEDFSDEEHADHINLPVNATLRGNIIVTSHLRSVVGDHKLLLDMQRLYGTHFFYDAVQLLQRQVSMATTERLPCNQLYLLRKAHEPQSQP